MGSPISPGDVLALGQAVYGLYKTYSDAPEEMKRCRHQISKVDSLLLDMVKPGNEVSYFKTNEGKELLAARDSALEDVNEILAELKEIGLLWQRDRKNPFRKFFFVNWTMNPVDGLRRQLRENWQDLRDIQDQAHKSGGVKIDSAQLESLINKIRDRTQTTRSFVVASQIEREQGSKKVRGAVEKSADTIAQAGNPLDQNRFQDVLQDLLKQQGVAFTDMSKLMKAAKPLQDQLFQYRQSSAYMEILVVAKPEEAAWALVVEACLELARVWSANVQGRWLYKRATSALFTEMPNKIPIEKANHNIYMPLIEAMEVYRKAVASIQEDLASLEPIHWPYENEAILSKLKGHRLQDIRHMNLKRYNFVLCVSERAFSSMKRLAAKGAFADDAVVDWIAASDDDRKRNVRGFLEDHFSWTKPSQGLGAGPNRTCWVISKLEAERDRVVGKEGVGRTRLEKETGCKIRTSWIGADRGWITAITGPPSMLRAATKAVELAKEKKWIPNLP